MKCPLSEFVPFYFRETCRNVRLLRSLRCWLVHTLVDGDIDWFDVKTNGDFAVVHCVVSHDTA